MYTKKQIIQEIKKVAEKLGSHSLNQQDFILNSTVPINTVKYHLGTWGEALKAAGLEPSALFEPQVNPEIASDEDLLKDLLRLYRLNGTEPNEEMVRAKGSYAMEFYQARWKTIKKAFWKAMETFPGEISRNSSEPVVSYQRNEGTPIRFIPHTIKPKRPQKKQKKLGDPIDFRGLRYAPADRDGLLFLFGMLALELGFELESISSEHPHGEGKRYFDLQREQWDHVRFAVLFSSSDFKKASHSSDDYEILVCWEHDFTDCPIEVLELKSVISELS